MLRISFFILILLFTIFMEPAQKYFSPADLEVAPKTNELFIIGESANDQLKYIQIEFQKVWLFEAV